MDQRSSPSNSSPTASRTAEELPLRPDGRPVKLKDSCDACGRSKVKCSREKPTCKRCATHGWTCEYGTSNRTGRISSKVYSTPVPLKPRPSRSDQEVWDAHYASSSRTHAALPEPTGNIPRTFSDVTPRNTFSESTEPWVGVGDGMHLLSPPTSLGNHEDMGGLWSAFPDTIEVDSLSNTDLFMPDSLLPLGPTFNSQGFQSSQLQDFRSMSDASASQLTRPDDPEPFRRSLLSSNSSFLATDSHSVNGDCLTNAMAILPALSSDAISTCSGTTSSSSSADPEIGSVVGVESAFDQTRHALHTVQQILECRCSEDEYLTSLLAVIVLKLLTRFVAVVHRPVSSEDSPFSADLVGTRDMTSQVIVDELRILQSVVQLLGGRLRQLKTQEAHAGSGESTTSGAVGVHHTPLSAFSTSTIEQMELELQSRLDAVTNQIQRSFEHY